MPSTARRLAGFTESVIRGMTRLANQHGAINLSQGFPDFSPPEELLAALVRALADQNSGRIAEGGGKSARNRGCEHMG